MAADPAESAAGVGGPASLFVLLGLGFQLVLERFVERLDAEGYGDLRPVHGLVFQAVLGGATTSTEVAERIGVTKQAAGNMVDQLERSGYLRRDAHPDGGRRRRITLTRHGLRHIEVAARSLRTLEDELADALSPTQMEDLRATLTSLIAHLAPEGPPPLRPVW